MEVTIEEAIERACFRHAWEARLGSLERFTLAFVNEARNEGLALKTVPHSGETVWRHWIPTASNAERSSSLRAGSVPGPTIVAIDAVPLMCAGC